MVLDVNRKRHIFSQLVPEFNWLVSLDVNSVWLQIDRDVKTVPAEDPQLCPNAEEWDHMPIEISSTTVLD